MKPASVLVLSALLAACGGGGGSGGGPSGPTGPTGPAPSSVTVNMGASTFNPASVRVARNGTVTWQNGSGLEHNVTFSTAGSPQDVPTFAGGSQSRTFPTTGTFQYQCTIHAPAMSGSVAVE